MIETDRNEILREFDPLTSKEDLISHNNKVPIEEHDKQENSEQSEKLHTREESLERGKQETIQHSGAVLLPLPLQLLLLLLLLRHYLSLDRFTQRVHSLISSCS